MRYALIENGIVTNVIEAGEEYIAPFGEAIATEEAGIGWQYQPNHDGQTGKFLPPVSAPESGAMHPPLSPRQIRLGLRQIGKLQDVPIIIASLPSPQREDAEIEWEYATSFRRDHPLIVALAPILGLGEEGIDAFWSKAAMIKD